MSAPASPPLSLFHTHVSEAAISRVTEVLRSGWLNEGAVVKEFEQGLTQTLGIVNPVALNSGTAALHLALVVAGIGPGDEVILPAQTFLATGTVIVQQGATPVFADIDPRTGNIDPRSVRAKITPRTKALVPVHWGGYPCDMDELSAIAREASLVVIEDAAHALGATYRGKAIGAISRFTTFSFQAIKHLTTGDGGALACATETDTRDAVARRWFGIDRALVQKTLIGARGYDVAHLGFKYHMNNVAAALGVGNLADFPQRLSRRRAIVRHYRTALAGVPGLELLESKDDRENACWLFMLLVERREDFVRRLAGAGIAATVVDLRIDSNSVFGGLTPDLPGQVAFGEREIAIPVHEGLSDADVERIVQTVRSGW